MLATLYRSFAPRLLGSPIPSGTPLFLRGSAEFLNLIHRAAETSVIGHSLHWHIKIASINLARYSDARLAQNMRYLCFAQARSVVFKRELLLRFVNTEAA